MQPIELDGIQAGSVPSLQSPAQLWANRVSEGERAVNTAHQFEPWAKSHSISVVPDSDNKRWTALVTQTTQIIHDFVVMDGQHRVGAMFATLHDLGKVSHRFQSVDAGKTALVYHSTGAGKTANFLGLLAAAATVSHGSDVALAQQTGRGFRHSFIGDLNRLESGYLLALSLSSPAWSTDGLPVPARLVEIEPLAIACGITRLTRPLIPRAPGPVDAAGRFGVGVHGLVLGLAA